MTRKKSKSNNRRKARSRVAKQMHHPKGAMPWMAPANRKPRPLPPDE